MLLPTIPHVTAPPPTALRLAMTTREPTNQHVVVSGLDGVLVDSEPATTRCAWLTASRLWPDVMEAAAEVPAQQAGVRRAWVNYDWTALTGEEEDGMPSWLSAKLRQLRPVVRDSGYEAVLLARLCAEEALAASRGSRGSRPLSVGEIESGWADGLRAVLMARYGVERQEVLDLHERVSQEWWNADPSGWLRANPLYDGAATALQSSREESGSRLVLLTRRQPWQARALLAHAGVEASEVELVDPAEWDDSSKVNALAALRRETPDAKFSFVDDSAATVVRCAADPRLLSVALYFASYGYSSAGQRASTGAVPRLRTLADGHGLLDVMGTGASDGQTAA